jgi:hypothetical protein
MKRLILLLAALLLNVSPTYAAPFTGSGMVYTLRTHDSVTFGANADWFSLVGVTSLGTCPTAFGGPVVLMLRDDTRGQRMFSLVLAAKSAGIPLTVRVDDTVKTAAGFCYAQAVF